MIEKLETSRKEREREREREKVMEGSERIQYVNDVRNDLGKYLRTELRVQILNELHRTQTLSKTLRLKGKFSLRKTSLSSKVQKLNKKYERKTNKKPA